MESSPKQLIIDIGSIIGPEVQDLKPKRDDGNNDSN
jgi:hypothetical protein